MRAFLTAPLLLLPLLSCGSPPAEPQDRLDGIGEGANTPPDQVEKNQLAQARRLLDSGQHAEARGLLEDLIAGRPELAEARQLLGRAIYEAAEGDPPDLDELQDAETELLAATRLDPARSEAWLDLGRLYEKEGHLEGALEAYRRSLRSNVYYKPGLLAAARMATQLGEERDAIRHLEVLRARPPVPPEVPGLEARCYLTLSEAVDQIQNQKEFLERALAAFTEIVEQSPKNAEGPAGKAFCLVRMAQKGFAPMDGKRIDDLYVSASKLDPTSPWPNYNLAVFLESDLVGDEAGAIENYTRALGRKKDHLPSLLNLAALYWNSGRKSDALPLYQRALPLIKDPRDRKRIEALVQQAQALDKD